MFGSPRKVLIGEFGSGVIHEPLGEEDVEGLDGDIDEGVGQDHNGLELVLLEKDEVQVVGLGGLESVQNSVVVDLEPVVLGQLVVHLLLPGGLLCSRNAGFHPAEQHL